MALPNNRIPHLHDIGISRRLFHDDVDMWIINDVLARLERQRHVPYGQQRHQVSRVAPGGYHGDEQPPSDHPSPS